MKKIGRREITRRALTVLGAVAVGPAALAACGGDEEGGLSCMDTSGLEPAQVALRAQKNYSDSSPHSDQTCTLCRFYQASSSATSCGTCRVVQGPIHPDGYCDLFAANG